MEPNDTDHLDEAADNDVRRLKRMLEARASATQEFQRVKNAMLTRSYGFRSGRQPPPRAFIRSTV
jgi:hypothetical protein